MNKSIVILQSNYIPWRGYFDLLNYADEFVIYDEVQYTKNDWRNRNRIVSPKGSVWLTIPVSYKFGQRIDETVVADPLWGKKHWEVLCQYYKKSPFFLEYKSAFEEIYLGVDSKFLSEINLLFMKTVCRILGINTRISSSLEYSSVQGKTARLVDICRQLGGSEYISGPAAKNYLDEPLFIDQGIAVKYMDYSRYPEYPQRGIPFDGAVSILDLLFNVGDRATSFMKSFSGNSPDQLWEK